MLLPSSWLLLSLSKDTMPDILRMCQAPHVQPPVPHWHLIRSSFSPGPGCPPSLCVVWQSLWPLSHVADGYVCVWERAQVHSCSCCCAMINGKRVFNGPLCTFVVIFQSWVQGWLGASHSQGPVCTKKQAKNRNHRRMPMRTNSYFIQTLWCWSVQKPFPLRQN